MTAARWSVLLVVALAALAHLPALEAGFVYDDHRFIERNARLEPLDPGAFLLDPRTASAGSGSGRDAGAIVPDIYRPLRTLLFAVERSVLGLWAPGWHAVSLLLHALNAWLVLRLLRRLLGPESPAALLGAAAFAVHPVTVESVAWLSSQGDLLAVALLLLALEAFTRAGAARTALGAALVGLACLAKESAVVAPLLLVVHDRTRPQAQRPAARVTLLRAGLLLLVVVGYFVLRRAVLPGLAQVPHPLEGWTASVRGALAALTWYAGALLWPAGFPFETDLPVPLGWGEPAVVLGAGILLTLLLAGLHAWRAGRPAGLLFAAWGVLVALIPVSQVAVPLKTLAAERFLYPALPAVAAALGAAALVLARGRLKPLAFVLLLAAVPWTLVSRSRAASWRDDVTLWEAVRADRPSNARAYEGLGFALVEQGKFAEGERAYTSYLKFNPYDGKTRLKLADQLGRLAGTLYSADPEVHATSELDRRRSEVRALQVTTLQGAIAMWDQVGFALGRGDPSLYREALLKLGAASLELGDLGSAALANDRLIEMHGLDPSDVARVLAQAPLSLRVTRWMLAWTAVTTPPPPNAPSEAYALSRRQRARVVAAMGLDAAQTDAALVRALEAPLGELRAAALRAALEAPAAERERAADFADRLDLMQAELLGRTGRSDEGSALLRQMAERRRARQGAQGR